MKHTLSLPRTKIHAIDPSLIGQQIWVCGWIRSVRSQKTFTFIELNDGSSLSSLQVIAEETLPNYKELLPLLSTGAAVGIQGLLVESPGHKQKWELKASAITVFGTCPAEEYPLQKKKHTFEFLRSIAHLRPRTNTQGAVARVRSRLSYDTHRFFNDRDFIFIPTPLITSSDTEGGGKQFRVTTLDLDKLPKNSDGTCDFTKDFFQKPAYLTVSGQLNGEAYACALSDIYTFGPTFRAELSYTPKHLAEFWMIEPEMAFTDLAGTIKIIEEYIKFVIDDILNHCAEDMEFFDQFIEKGLLERLQVVLSSPFAQISYTEAIDILNQSGRTFEYPVHWGMDLQTEHERYLAEEYCKKPVFLTNYPEKIKAFYMRTNDDGKTVAAVDLLVPKIGELVGGSQREDRLEKLERKIIDFGLKPDDYWWYNQLRKYGTVPHSGFGVGFERLLLFATGMENIRDVIPFPRYPGHAEF
ncbi:MAG TPA: asparagine--tRNA ligase [Rhabdochlamydiaceae bacterium]|nr:asparagine--tRNA ligase [Rhabdochlamydiaceae bacterium]